MGIGGHMLGAKKLRQLSAKTGLPLSRAANRNGDAIGIVWNEDGTCTHYEIDADTGKYLKDEKPIHFTSCPESFTRNASVERGQVRPVGELPHQ